MTGIDITSEMIALAEDLNPGVVFHEESMEKFEMGQNKYDAVTAVYSLFHLPVEKQSVVFKKVYQALKWGGKFLFTYASEEYTKHEEFADEIVLMILLSRIIIRL